MINFLNTHLIFLLPIILLMGMAIGNFLNIIATYLPYAMKRTWQRQCMDYLDIQPIKSSFQKKILQCPCCENTFHFWITLPFIRTFLFKETCPQCQNSFTLRFPIIEASTGIITTLLTYYSHFSWALLFHLVLAWGLILLIIIDREHCLLPDNITLPLLWLGLFANIFNLFTSTQQSILGAIIAYATLFLVSRIFKQIRGSEGLGLGDCKLFAVFGAWWGAEALLPILLIASLTGSAIGMIKMLLSKQTLQTHIPFGPYLILGAVLTNLVQHLQ